MTHPNEQVVRELFAAYGQWDEAAMRALLADDIVYRVPGRGPFAGAHRGPDAVLALWADHIAAAGGRPLRTELETILANDERAVVLLTVAARRDDRSFRWRATNAYRLATGRVAECVIAVDDLDAFDDFWSSAMTSGHSS